MNFLKWLERVNREMEEKETKDRQKYAKFSPNYHDRLIQLYTTYETHLLVRETNKLVKKTHWLAIGTWILAIATIILVIISTLI